MGGEHLLHLALIAAVARVDIVVLLAAALAKVGLFGGVEIFLHHGDHAASDEAEAEGIPAAVEHQRVGVGEIFGGGEHVGCVEKHDRSEIEIVAHRSRLIVVDRMVAKRTVGKTVAEVAICEGRVDVGRHFCQPADAMLVELDLLVVELHEHKLFERRSENCLAKGVDRGEFYYFHFLMSAAHKIFRTGLRLFFQTLEQRGEYGVALGLVGDCLEGHRHHDHLAPAEVGELRGGILRGGEGHDRRRVGLGRRGEYVRALHDIEMLVESVGIGSRFAGAGVAEAAVGVFFS